MTKSRKNMSKRRIKKELIKNGFSRKDANNIAVNNCKTFDKIFDTSFPDINMLDILKEKGIKLEVVTLPPLKTSK